MSACGDIVRRIEKLEGVKKVYMGRAFGKRRHSRPVGSMKFRREIDTGFRMLAYTDRGIIEVFVIVNGDRAVTKTHITGMEGVVS